jgi:hypothetical protein
MTRTLAQLALILAALPVAAWMPQPAPSQQPGPDLISIGHSGTDAV